jgi:hypothetical protein
MKLLIMTLSPLPCFFVPLRVKYLIKCLMNLRRKDKEGIENIDIYLGKVQCKDIWLSILSDSALGSSDSNGADLKYLTV